MYFHFSWIAIGVVVTLCLILVLKPRKPFMSNLRGKHVFLTGASSGIGLEIAKQALQEGAYLTLVARNSERMTKVAMSLLKELDCSEDRLLVKAADVADYTAISTAVKDSFDWRPIDILVNNAGVTISGLIQDLSAGDLQTVVQTNFLGSVYALHAVLPQLVLRSRDHPVSIVFMGSLASLCWLYGNGVYTGTKYAIKGVAECLRLELAPYNIRVSLVCPGFVNTPMLNAADNMDELKAGMQAQYSSFSLVDMRPLNHS
uniref:Ketoreductase domain-containing protein n=1 Tax=Physcomitrium patens TaxID=3218 RepID=A0A7I4CG17_PHYPA